MSSMLLSTATRIFAIGSINKGKYWPSDEKKAKEILKLIKITEILWGWISFLLPNRVTLFEIIQGKKKRFERKSQKEKMIFKSRMCCYLGEGE